MNDEDVISRAELDELLNDDPVGFLEALLEAIGCDGNDELEELDGDELDTLHGYSVSCVDATGGHEGGGESVERVVEVSLDKQPIIWFKIKGSFSSYVGTEWESWEQTYPLEEVVTNYYDKDKWDLRAPIAAEELRAAVGKLNSTFQGS